MQLNNSHKPPITGPKLPPYTIWLEALALTIYSLLCFVIGFGTAWLWHTMR